MTEQAQQRYYQLRQEYGGVLGKITEFESEKREHLIVLENLRKVEPTRRCWRLVGDALVEKQVSEIIPALEQQCGNMDQVMEALFKKLKETEGELRQLEQLLGVKTDIKQTEPQPTQQKSSGVLVSS
ncbi:unnamed protein product [Blepharisma stoltei]|uniref:Prefoldin subunit 2 n=1 Tax=Blepharisma stoltei TaxID=1481888 RepID=A0AAU9JUB8_9CILI|nr:unnamed protein product [Blepharisma stoltei]|mmetsp:Transcript_3450/g.3185  ORF Transcript_3450/g.3185 Transcript_3450/m.3185 type:complete len:127 (+) Transcript_3450:20-400(+)